MQTFVILIPIFILLNITKAMKLLNFTLPQSGECGRLNENFLFNEENVPAAGEYPWFGLVQVKTVHTDYTFFQNIAVLISRRHLLTNNYIFDRKEFYEPISVLLGKTGSTHPGQLYTIADIAFHPNFYGSNHLEHNGITVLTLSEDVVFSERIQPICLPPPPSPSDAVDNFVAQYLPSAFYYYSFAAAEHYEFKRVAHVIGAKRCQQVITFTAAAEEHICVNVSIEHENLYLIGSALMGVAIENSEPKYHYLLGLNTDAGYIAKATTTPSVFIKVAPFLNWIKTNAV